MKLINFDYPVLSSWFHDNGSRLDSKPYLSGAAEARALLARLRVPKEPLINVTKGYMGGIYNGPQFARNYVENEEYGVSFLTSGTMLLADFSKVGFLRRKDALSPKLSYLRLEQGMTLITCSGTIGRMVYTGPHMEGMWSSQDILKVVPDPDKILAGYLYAYLSSKFGVPQVIEGTYGAIIQHIEPHHIAGLSVPRLDNTLETAAHRNIAEAARLRCTYQAQVKQATELLFSSMGLHDITAQEWHAMGPDLGFSRFLNSPTSLRALNFNPRLEKILAQLANKHHALLGDICYSGKLRRGLRFKRIDCEPERGVKLIGQRELFWLEPEGRWIAPQYAPDDIFVEDETIVIAAQGTLGEHEVFCRAEFITGPWLHNAYTEHLLRVQSGNATISGAFLFAFLRSETVFRCLRSISIGSKQQDLHHALLANFPVPIPPQAVRQEIESLVRDAYKQRHEASRLEKEAVTMVETAIEEEARRWQTSSQ